MTLSDFYSQLQADISEKLLDPDNELKFRELVFADTVMSYMSEIGITYEEPQVCYVQMKYRNANLRLAGYSVSELEGLDLFVSIYTQSDSPENITDVETQTAAEQCLKFLDHCRRGNILKIVEPSHEAHDIAFTISQSYEKIDPIRIYVITNRIAKSKYFKPRQYHGKTIKLEVMDIERLYRHWSEGKPQEEIIATFQDLCGSPLPCVYIPASDTDYDCALTMFPGETLRFLYDKYGSRLLEANVRSFLSVSNKVNKGIRDTIRECPARFMAFNNGIVIVTERMELERLSDGSLGISTLTGLQIVNGGQTTASLYFTKKKHPETNLFKVRVPTKILVLKEYDRILHEELISSISRFSNSQSAVRQADLSSNKPFHVALEKLSTQIYCPDSVGRWFYERTTGSYNVMLMTQGSTPAKMRNIKAAIPTSRKINKTDLAKFLNAWDGRPHVVSLGAQKNFVDFMKRLDDDLLGVSNGLSPSVYKEFIAKALIYKGIQRICRKNFSAFQANITAYTVALISQRLGGHINLDQIWQNQDISIQFKTFSEKWAQEVKTVIFNSAKDSMVSEWAKKEKCWHTVLNAVYSSPPNGTMEILEP